MSSSVSQRVSAATPPHPAVEKLIRAVETVIRGKNDVIQAAVVSMLAEGHLLLEDVPGVGKTTLARSLARALGGTFQRVQFTSDLLPGDVIGVSVYNQSTGEFSFRSGPVFANVVLADEINRATPKTQSALLEAMAEGRVTVDGKAHPLPTPFLVVATQNPIDHAGTYPLPESQLDRFMMRVRVGYPDASAERELLKSGRPEASVSDIEAVMSLDDVRALQGEADEVEVHDDIVDYVQRLAAATRDRKGVVIGASPRAALHLLRAARALALVSGRRFVVPDDVQDVAEAVLAHRLVVRGGQDADAVIEEVLEEVPVPG